MIVTSFQDLKLRGKQISQSTSYCELINSPRNGTKVRMRKVLATPWVGVRVSLAFIVVFFTKVRCL